MEGSEVFKIYLDELEDIEPLTDKELSELEQINDKKSKGRLVEGYLRMTMGIVSEYVGQGIDITDLVSEANLELTRTVNDFDGTGNLKELIENNIREACERAIEDDAQLRAQDEDLANRVNELSDLSVVMVQELGRQPTTEELAQRLNISTEAVDALIRMSMDALSDTNEGRQE